MEDMANDHYTKQRSRSRSITIYIAVLGALSLGTFVFALYNLIQTKNVQVQVRVLENTIGRNDKPSEFRSGSNRTEISGSLIKAEDSLEWAKDDGKSRIRRASSKRSKRQDRNSLSALSRGEGKKRPSGVTFTFDYDSRWCEGQVSNNRVHPPKPMKTYGWELNCWKFNKEDFNINFALPNSDSKAIIIAKEGIYFLYTTLTFIVTEGRCRDTHASVGYSVIKASPETTSLLRCVASTKCTDDFRVSCYAGKVVRLKKHDRLSVKIQGDLDHVSSVLTNPESTYVGLLKLHGK